MEPTNPDESESAHIRLATALLRRAGRMLAYAMGRGEAFDAWQEQWNHMTDAQRDEATRKSLSELRAMFAQCKTCEDRGFVRITRKPEGTSEVKPCPDCRGATK